MSYIDRSFFQRDVLEVAPQLIGKILCRKFDDGKIIKLRITETEAYRGEEDLACHASKGRTQRTEVMYHEGGKLYMYLIYGMYWMLNIVTGGENEPQATLIRGLEGVYGPGRLTRHLSLDKSFYGETLGESQRIWLENDGIAPPYIIDKRIGVEYAKEWAQKPWRFLVNNLK